MASQAIDAKVKPGAPVTAISEDEWKTFASYLRMDVGEFKLWAEKSPYGTQKLRKLFSEDMKEFPLHQAAMNGASALVILVLKKLGAHSVNGRDEHNKTALHYAARIGHMNIVNLLLKEPYVEADLKDDDGFTPLMEAASSGHEKIIERILQAAPGVDVNNTDNSNRTALHVSALKGHDSVVDFLLETEGLRMNCNIQDSDGDSALHNAAQMGHAGIVAKVLKAGVDVNLRNSNGETALHCAVEIGDETIAAEILEAGVDVNLRNSDGEIALHYAAKLGRLSMVELILPKSDASLKDTDGETPLHVAAWYGHEDVVEKLINEQSVDVNSISNHDVTALHFAVGNGCEGVVVKLLEVENIDVNIQDDDGDSPLHYAALNGYDSIAEKILQSDKVDVKLRNGEYKNALHLAVEKGHLKVFDVLMNQQDVSVTTCDRDGNSLLHIATKSGNEQIVGKILAKTTVDDVNYQNDSKLTALHIAAKKGHATIITRILEVEGVKLSLKTKAGKTALHLAAEKGHSTIVASILAVKGVNILNAQTKAGDTALHLAARNGHEACVEILLKERGVNLNLKNHHGESLLYIAAKKDSKSMLKMIHTSSKRIKKENGKPDIWHEYDNDGWTIVHLAAQNHYLNVFDFFQELKKVDFNCVYTILHQPSKTEGGKTALDIAVEKNDLVVVEKLVDFNCIKLTAKDTEDEHGKTLLHRIFEMRKKEEIFKILRRTAEVRDYIDALYKDRQASVDASNAMLVGAALIASVTFAAWLQPPLGYTPYYYEQYTDYSGLAPPVTSNPSYASVEHHPSLQWFWVCNSLSFFCAIATVISGARSVLPARRVFIKQEVLKLRENLVVTAIMLTFSMVFVLLAFATAGVIVLPPTMKYRTNMFATIGIGGTLCLIFLVMLVRSISYLVADILFHISGISKEDSSNSGIPKEDSFNSGIPKEDSSFGLQLQAAMEMAQDTSIKI